MNYIIYFKQGTSDLLEVIKIPRDDGKGPGVRPSGQPGTSSFGTVNQFQRNHEERGKSERGHVETKRGIGPTGVVLLVLLLTFSVSLQDDGSFQVSRKTKCLVFHTFTLRDAIGHFSIKAGM